MGSKRESWRQGNQSKRERRGEHPKKEKVRERRNGCLFWGPVFFDNRKREEMKKKDTALRTGRWMRKKSRNLMCEELNFATHQRVGEAGTNKVPSQPFVFGGSEPPGSFAFPPTDLTILAGLLRCSRCLLLPQWPRRRATSKASTPRQADQTSRPRLASSTALHGQHGRHKGGDNAPSGSQPG